MARRKRVVGNPGHETAEGRFDVEELDENGEVIIDETVVILPEDVSKGVIVHTQEQTITFRSGHEVLRSGGKKQRLFSPETHGADWREKADSFIASCKIEDGERRPKFIKAEEF